MKLSTIKDLNDISNGGVLLVALEIFIPDTPVVRVINNSENIIFKGNEYVAFPFSIGELSAAKGETPTFQLQIDNTSRAMQQYIQAYDNYLKTHGVGNSAIKAIVYVVNSNDLDEEIFSENFELTEFSSDSSYVTFTLGTNSLFSMSYPPRKMYKDYCMFGFKSEQCGYRGSDGSCKKTLADCRAKGNSERFGGFLGIAGGYKQ
jgi:hypothetical protein